MSNVKVITTEALIEKFQQAIDQKWGYIWGTAGELWTQALQDKLNKTTDSDRAQGREYGKKWIGHMVADCSGLFTWAFRMLGGTMYHGSDTMYRKWCTDKGELKKGKRTDGKELKPGTAVFVWNGTKYSHVGLYIGNGWVIEAESTIKGVVKSKVTANKWSHWGELKGVSYSAQNAQEPASDPQEGQTPAQGLPTLRKGDKGQYVTLLQTKLKSLGYDLGRWGIDGDYGSATQAAVRAFQKDHGLVDDGICGPKTWAALEKGEPEKLYTVTIRKLSKSRAQEIVGKYGGSISEEI